MGSPTKARSRFKAIRGDQCAVMRGVSWALYEAVLAAKGDRCYPKLLYLDGDLYFMSPAFRHEFIKTRAGLFVHEVCVGCGVCCVPSASTTFRLGKKKGGFEGDQSYYFANAHRLRNRFEIDLELDPPPDLVIEVSSLYKQYAVKAFPAAVDLPGVLWRLPSEMWICDEHQFRILVRQAGGKYAESETSASLPFLKAEEIETWLRHRMDDEDETSWAIELREWVRDVVAPRVRGVQAR